VPVALIFCFENAAHFIAAPALMAFAGGDERPRSRVALDVAKKIAYHPFIIATAIGFLAAGFQFEPPLALQRLIDYLAQAAAPCALFAMGVTLALRPLKRIPAEIGYIVPIKLNGKDGYRVLFGNYASSDAARAGIQNLPQRYKDAFAPTLHMLDGSQNMP